MDREVPEEHASKKEMKTNINIVFCGRWLN
jgi:hypothetical protein